ncbi:acyl-CoA reductase [Achromobacter sp. GG226]|uniref:acyl-CoA reductase n=1 Tax=Verticiella alkaliphila TaxID=2779529 RepID=UPI001C0CB28F|nr:acyl-CoA reductase [Verticiella sp. GG226]MBU4612050.1 acyl-CoA reductase [Verticiella sp. GG226]
MSEREPPAAATAPAASPLVGYLPPGIEPVPPITRTFTAHAQTVTLALPLADAAHVEAVTQAVRSAARRVFADLPVLAVVDAVDRTVARMLDPADPARQQAERILPVITGFDPAMVQQGLTAALAGFRRPQLLRWLAEEFGDAGVLDDFRPRPRGGWSRAYGAHLLGHVWAGNVPGIPLWSLISGLLTKAGSVGKVASDEPWLAGWFARTLAEVEPRLAGAIAILWWPGEDTAPSRALAQASEVLVVYGGDPALQAWHAHAPASTRLVAHGHRVSAALVAREVLDTRQAQAAARQAALDVARWDQQGCYSPQMIYVEDGGQVTPRDFAALLAGELAAVAHRFARRTLTLAQSQAFARWRQTLARHVLANDAVHLLGTADAPWGVAYLADATLAPQCALNRSICVIAVPALDAAVSALAPLGAVLQTAALAAPPARLFALSGALGAAGVTRICALGHAALPEVGWHPDGRFSLLDLVRMVDLEAGAEQAADAYTVHRD